MANVISEYGTIVNGGGETIQYQTMPTASESNLNKVVQYIGNTTATYTNGYFYKCVSDGEATPTYSWENIDVQEGGSGEAVFLITVTFEEDPQTGEEIELIDVTPAQVQTAWEAGKCIQLTSNEDSSIYSLTQAEVDGNDFICELSNTFNNENGSFISTARLTSNNGIWNPIKWIHRYPTEVFTINITGEGTQADPYEADKTPEEVDEAYTKGDLIRLCVDGTFYPLINYYTDNYVFHITSVVPETGYNQTETETVVLHAIDSTTWDEISFDVRYQKPSQLSQLPNASSYYLGQIYQYIGSTNVNYTNGYFYKCVKTQSNPDVYGWEQIDVQLNSEAVFTITLTGDGDETPYSVDKTPAEVIAAYDAGKVLQLKYAGTNQIAPMMGGSKYGTFFGAVFGMTAVSSSGYAYSNKEYAKTEMIQLMSSDGVTWNISDQSDMLAPVFTTMPIPSVKYLGKTVQYLGVSETPSEYIHGYFYECVQTSSDPATYEWQQIDVQPGSDVSGKADKVSGATNGNFAALNSSGNLTDSGKKAGDFVLTTAIGTAAAKDVPTSGNASASQVVMGNDTRLSDARTPASHNQAASTITAGTLAGRVQANATAAATLANAQVRDVVISTTDLTPGTSALAAGSVYIVYE